MTNIEKCKVALAQGLRVQVFTGHWLHHAGHSWMLDDKNYRIHPDDEAKFVEPGATSPNHINLSTRTINGRTYTHRTRVGGICRIICRDLISTHPVVVAVLREEGSEITALYKSEDGLTPGADPAFDVDWSKVAIDTPIWVRNSAEDPWKTTHFAGAKDRQVRTFSCGATSHSTDGHFVYWNYASLTKPE